MLVTLNITYLEYILIKHLTFKASSTEIELLGKLVEISQQVETGGEGQKGVENTTLLSIGCTEATSCDC